jgi:hypothetical protein
MTMKWGGFLTSHFPIGPCYFVPRPCHRSGAEREESGNGESGLWAFNGTSRLNLRGVGDKRFWSDWGVRGTLVPCIFLTYLLIYLLPDFFTSSGDLGACFASVLTNFLTYLFTYLLTY